MTLLRKKESNEGLDELIFKTADKDVRSFDELYEKTRHVLFGYALTILRNRHDAEDALHDTYIQIYKNADKYTSASKPLAWLLTITKNICLGRINEKERFEEMDEEEWIDSFKQGEGISVIDRDLLYNCLNTLSEEDRQVVILHSLTGYKHVEIAELLNISTNTVLSKYNRAIKKLQSLIHKEAKDEGY